MSKPTLTAFDDSRLGDYSVALGSPQLVEYFSVRAARAGVSFTLAHRSLAQLDGLVAQLDGREQALPDARIERAWKKLQSMPLRCVSSKCGVSFHLICSRIYKRGYEYQHPQEVAPPFRGN